MGLVSRADEPRAARVTPKTEGVKALIQGPSRDRSQFSRQTGLRVTPQPGCCHHAHAWASNRAQALLIAGRNLGLRPIGVSPAGVPPLFLLAPRAGQLHRTNIRSRGNSQTRRRLAMEASRSCATPPSRLAQHFSRHECADLKSLAGILGIPIALRFT